jgi:uncharacterized membrane protein
MRRIDLPVAANLSGTIAPQFISFVISFAVVAVFWYGHRMESHWLFHSDQPTP